MNNTGGNTVLLGRLRHGEDMGQHRKRLGAGDADDAPDGHPDRNGRGTDCRNCVVDIYHFHGPIILAFSAKEQLINIGIT